MSPAILAIRLIDAAATILYLLIVARILLSWFPVSPWNPVMRWLRRIVDPILRPFRRVLPTFGGIDFSPLLAILTIFIVQSILDAILSSGSANIPHILIGFLVQLIQNIVLILGILVLIRLLLELFVADPWHPLVMGVRSMTNPLVRPFAGTPARRRYGAGLDVPALVTLIVYAVIYAVLAIVVAPLVARSF